MNRIRWMSAKFPGSIRQLGKGLQQIRFTEESGQGFIIDRIRDDSLEARYIERVAFTESLTDPFGNNFTINRLEYRVADFTLSKTFPELELRMPPRGLKGLTNGLQKASEHSMVLEQNIIKVRRWVSAIERNVGSKVVIRGAVATGIELEEGATAKIAISGPRDVRSGFSELAPKRQYNWDSVQIDYPGDTGKYRIVLGADSSIRFDPDTPEELISSIRDALRNTGGETR